MSREKSGGEGGRCGWGKILFRRFACQRGLKRNIAKTRSPRPLYSGRGLVRTESGCVQTSLEFSPTITTK